MSNSNDNDPPESVRQDEHCSSDADTCQVPSPGPGPWSDLGTASIQFPQPDFGGATISAPFHSQPLSGGLIAPPAAYGNQYQYTSWPQLPPSPPSSAYSQLPVAPYTYSPTYSPHAFNHSPISPSPPSGGGFITPPHPPAFLNAGHPAGYEGQSAYLNAIPSQSPNGVQVFDPAPGIPMPSVDKQQFPGQSASVPDSGVYLGIKIVPADSVDRVNDPSAEWRQTISASKSKYKQLAVLFFDELGFPRIPRNSWLEDRGLPELLEKSIGGQFHANFSHAMHGLLLGPLAFDVWELGTMIYGSRSVEYTTLSEILLDRSERDIRLLISAYKAQWGNDLASDIVISKYLREPFKQLYDMALCHADERWRPKSEVELHDAVSLLLETVSPVRDFGKRPEERKETLLCILALNSPSDLRYMWEKLNDLEEVIHRADLSTSEWHAASHMISPADPRLARESASAHGDNINTLPLEAQLEAARVERDADLLHDAMKGFGTRDSDLIVRVIRNFWNKQRWYRIMARFQQKHGRSLATAVRSETSGDYQALMAMFCQAENIY